MKGRNKVDEVADVKLIRFRLYWESSKLQVVRKLGMKLSNGQEGRRFNASEVSHD